MSEDNKDLDPGKTSGKPDAQGQPSEPRASESSAAPKPEPQRPNVSVTVASPQPQPSDGGDKDRQSGSAESAPKQEESPSEGKKEGAEGSRRPDSDKNQGQGAQDGGRGHGRRRRRRRGRGGRGDRSQQEGSQQKEGQDAGGQKDAQQKEGLKEGQKEGAKQEGRQQPTRQQQGRQKGRQQQNRQQQGRQQNRQQQGRNNQRKREEGRQRDTHRSGERFSGGGTSGKKVKSEILANTSFEETRIAIVEDGRLAELLWERQGGNNIVGNIYKGQVENVLPGISSAFVNIGYEKNAYLYISDVLGARGTSIDAILKRGQQVMIQVSKGAISTKGMKVTMDISLPGRFLVFTPFQEDFGVSKHIEDAEERKRLTKIVTELSKQYLDNKGIVIRTEAEGASQEDLEREVKYLKGAWDATEAKFQSRKAPALIHKDLGLALQVARDILSDETYCYFLDNKENHGNVLDFVTRISPELAGQVKYYDAKTPIFTAFDLEKEIEDLRKTKVSLPNGGSIIIQEAESLCAIDVNTGRFTGSKSQEDTVTQTNIEAAKEIAHQIRLRNIGGIIVIDFIDMRRASSRNKVMETFASAVKRDRAKIRILPITRLGLIEMTRERKRESTMSLITDDCPQCKGGGRVLSSETMRIKIQREITEMTAGRPGGQIRILLHPTLADVFKSLLGRIERNVQRSVKIQGDVALAWEDYRIVLE